VFRMGLMVVFLSVAACAYSPQQVTINPIVDTSGERYGEGRAVKVSVEDRRASKVIGSRGGLYKETSLITISNDINVALVKAAEATLATQGFNVNAVPEQSPANVNIVIQELAYNVPDQSIGKKLSLKAVLLVEASIEGKSYNGRYETNTNRQGVVTPSNAKNEQMINALISETLANLFDDVELKAFLSNI
jgi:uncharacterized lipoprotein